MTRRILIQACGLILIICIATILKTIFQSDYIETKTTPKTEILKCIFDEIKTEWINSEYAYRVTTQNKDTFYIMPERINDFEYSGILKRLKKNTESDILYRIVQNKYKSIEQITHRGRIYMGVKEQVEKIKRNSEGDNFTIIVCSVVILLILLGYFLVIIPMNETSQIKSLYLYNSSIKELSFPISKGDLRISKIKDYYVIDKKENFEFIPVLKLYSSHIIKSNLVWNKRLQIDKLQYLYLNIYQQSDSNSLSETYYADFYYKTFSGRTLNKLFTYTEHYKTSEKGLNDYFTQNSVQIAEIFGYLMKCGYKLKNEL